MRYRGEEIQVFQETFVHSDDAMTYVTYASVCWDEKTLISIPEHLIDRGKEVVYKDFEIDLIPDDKEPYKEFGVYYRDRYIVSLPEQLLKEVIANDL